MFTQAKNRFRSGIWFFLLTFVANTCYVPIASAQGFSLPAPGVRMSMSPAFTPSIIRGMTIDTKNPFAFSFLVDKGDQVLSQDEKKEQYERLIKYFLSAMTIPEGHQWVNLSPYEKNRIIEEDFGKTEMGRDLLGQDYFLKQITASLIYPEEQLGKEFWAKVYKEAQEKFGTTQIPVNTFNKVWIMPESADMYEKDSTVLIVDSKLKVMLEEDYLAVEKNANKVGASVMSSSNDSVGDSGAAARELGKKILKEIVIPQLTKEVNEGKNFANLRQIYHGMILAAWYKQNLKESILTKIYADKGKVKGVDLANPTQAQQDIYQQYLKAFKKGVYNYVKEEADPLSGEMIPRKYFSGGFNPAMSVALREASLAQVASFAQVVEPRLDVAKAMIASAPAQPAAAAMTATVPEFKETEYPVANLSDIDGPKIKAVSKDIRDQILKLFETNGGHNFDVYKRGSTYTDTEKYYVLENQEVGGHYGQAYPYGPKDDWIPEYADVQVEKSSDITKMREFEYIDRIIRVLLENLYQHEYTGLRDKLKMRVYKSTAPVEGIRVEFWGPGSEELPKTLTSRPWFYAKFRPWEGKAPETSQSGHGVAIQALFQTLEKLGPEIFVSWRKSTKADNGVNDDGHIIALHIPFEETRLTQHQFKALLADGVVAKQGAKRELALSMKAVKTINDLIKDSSTGKYYGQSSKATGEEITQKAILKLNKIPLKGLKTENRLLYDRLVQVLSIVAAMDQRLSYVEETGISMSGNVGLIDLGKLVEKNLLAYQAKLADELKVIDAAMTKQEARQDFAMTYAPKLMLALVMLFSSDQAIKEYLKYNFDLFTPLALEWEKDKLTAFKKMLANPMKILEILEAVRDHNRKVMGEFEKANPDKGPNGILNPLAEETHNAWLFGERKNETFVEYTKELHNFLLELIDAKVMSVSKEDFLNPTKKFKFKPGDINWDKFEGDVVARDALKARLAGFVNGKDKFVINTVAGDWKVLNSIEGWGVAKKDRPTFLYGLQADSVGAILSAFSDVDIIKRLGTGDQASKMATVVEFLRRINVGWRLNNPWNGIDSPLLGKPFALAEDGGIGIDDIQKDAVVLKAILEKLYDAIQAKRITIDLNVAQELQNAFQNGLGDVLNVAVDKELLAKAVKENPVKDTFSLDGINAAMTGDERDMAMQVAKLRNGSEEALPNVMAIYVSLESLMDKGFAGGLALYELHQKALNPNHKVDEGYSQFLRDLNLIESDGNLHDVTKNIVLSSIEGEGLEMRLVNPVVSTRDAAMADKDNSYGAYEDYMAEFRPSMDHSRALLYEEWRAQVDAGYNVLDGTKDSSEAMTTKDLGGIDLDSANLNLRIKRDGKGVPLPINLQDPAMMNAPGFIPIILEIKPAINLPIFSELRNGAAKT